MQLKILGPVCLHMQEQVQLGATKVRGLLGYLSFKANESVPVDRIVEALWDHDAPPDAAKSLQTHVSRLRRVFKEANCPAEVIREHQTYRLDVALSTIDYQVFTATVRNGYRAAGRGEHREAAELFTAALSLWRGTPIADVTTSWAQNLQETLTLQHLLPAQCALFDAKLELGDHEFVLAHVQPLLADHVHDERLARQWMRALAAANRAAEIPTFFRAFAGRLADDLGHKPDPALVQLYRDTTSQHRRAAIRPARTPTLPRDTRYFTGRADLLERLDTLLAGADRTTTVVAIDGSPGVGKTTLVKRWAYRRRELFPDGILYADLAGHAGTPMVEPASVLATFLDELGFPITQIPTGASDRAALLRHALASRRALVVLDNVRDSAHVRPLRDAIGDCPTLITSRQQLTGLAYQDGVQQLTVPPLAPDEAESLLHKRIGHRAADDPAAISRLVALCDGLPLALRIVSEHVTLRPAPAIADLVDELGHTKRLLDAGQHGDEHGTTLRSAFAWSYHALHPEHRRLFRLLGLLPGSRFSVHAAAAVSGLDRSDVEQGLDALLGAHLVEQEHAGRYRTHDLLHRFARACVGDDEPDAPRQQAFRRILDWYLQSARRGWTYLTADPNPVPDLTPDEPVEALDFPTNDEALRWFVVERANLFSLVHLAADQGCHEHVWRLSACLHVLSKFEDPRPLLAIHELGRSSAARAGQTIGEAGCLSNMGTIYCQLNDDLRAGRCFELAAHAFHVAGDIYAEAIGMHNIGTIHLKLGALREAIGWFRKAIAIFTRTADQWAIANTLRRLGDAHRKLDQHREAASSYRQSLYTCQKNDDLRGQGATLSRLAELSLDQHNLDRALAYGTEALDIFDRIQVDQEGKAAALYTIAATYLQGGNYPKAITIATETVRTCQATRNTSAQIDALLLLGRAQAASGEPTQAAAAGTAAITLLDTPDDPRAAELHALLRLPAGQPVPSPRPADPPQGAVDGGHPNTVADEITGTAS